jgi:hypothetical protein
LTCPGKIAAISVRDKVVSRHHPDRSARDHRPRDAFGGDAAILGVGATQQFIEQEQDRQRRVQQIADRADAQRLRIEARSMLL